MRPSDTSDADFVDDLAELLDEAGAKLTFKCPRCKREGGEVVEHVDDCLTLLPDAFRPLLQRLVSERNQAQAERNRLERALKGTVQCIHLLDRPVHFMLDRWKKLEVLGHRVRTLARTFGEFPDDPECLGGPLDAVIDAYDRLDPKSPFVEFQRLWTAATGTDSYVAAEWAELERRLICAMRGTDAAELTKTMAEAYALTPAEMH